MDGRTYVEELDGTRLRGQLAQVYRVLLDSARGRDTAAPRAPRGPWWTLPELQAELRVRFGTYATETSLSARVRDLRKERHGAHEVPTRRRPAASSGLWEFCLVLPAPAGQLELGL